jgi:hypothetical protein
MKDQKDNNGVQINLRKIKSAKEEEPNSLSTTNLNCREPLVHPLLKEIPYKARLR